MTIGRKPYRILLVEDNPGDVRLTQEAFKEGDTPIELSVTMDGVEAMRFLQKSGKYHDAPTPELILLDLNLPKKSGREVLGEIKRDPDLRKIPVIILTTSNAEVDIRMSYDLHANCYINKPVDFDNFFTLIQRIQEFWLSSVVLPSSIQ